MDFKGGEFYDGEEAAMSLRYEKLFGYCKLCGSLCHKEELCPLKEKNAKSSPARRRETREGTGGWFDGTKHEEQARSYKGVVINGHTGQQHKGRDSREYYGKGKGKMVDAADSKWVKAAERGSRKPPTHHGYRGDGESSRHKNTRRDDGRNGVTGGELAIRSHVLDPLQNSQRMINVRGFQVRKHGKKERLRAMEMMLRYYRMRGFNLS